MLVLREEAIGITTLERVGMEGMHVDKVRKIEQNMGFSLYEGRGYRNWKVARTRQWRDVAGEGWALVRAGGRQKVNSVPARWEPPHFTWSSTRSSNSGMSWTNGHQSFVTRNRLNTQSFILNVFLHDKLEEIKGDS